LIELDNGAHVVVYYGKDSQQLTLEIPETTSDSSALLASFFSEVPLPRSRVLWHRSDTELPNAVKTKRSARRVVMPGTRK